MNLVSPIRTIANRACAVAFGFVLLATPLPSPAADPIELTVLLPLTGYAAFFGVPQVQALKGIESYVNKTGGIGGRPIKFVVKDDQTNPQVDVQLATEYFATTKLPMLLGPDTAGQCNAVSALAQAKGPVLFCFTNAIHPPAGSFIFGAGAETAYMAQAIFHYFAAHNLKRVAMITTTDASGADGDKMLAAESQKENTLTLVDRQYFAPTDVSVTAQMAHIKASNPQAIVVWVTGTPFGTVLRAMKDLGMDDIPLLASPADLLYGQLRQYASLMPKQLIFPSQAYLAPETVTDKGVKDAIAVMTSELAALGAKPDQGHNSDWDGVMLVISGLRMLGIDTTPEKLRDYLANLKGWAGIDGRYDFTAEPQRGLDKKSIIMVQYDPAKESFFGISKGGGEPLR